MRIVRNPGYFRACSLALEGNSQTQAIAARIGQPLHLGHGPRDRDLANLPATDELARWDTLDIRAPRLPAPGPRPWCPVPPPAPDPAARAARWRQARRSYPSAPTSSSAASSFHALPRRFHRIRRYGLLAIEVFERRYQPRAQPHIRDTCAVTRHGLEPTRSRADPRLEAAPVAPALPKSRRRTTKIGPSAFTTHIQTVGERARPLLGSIWLSRYQRKSAFPIARPMITAVRAPKLLRRLAASETPNG